MHADCRHPVLDSTTLGAPLGHESGFSADGKTFYATATATPSITAIDVSDPTHPHAIWQGNIVAHGMTLSADGNRAYVADPTGGDMLILDTSQIQARKANPQVREISRLGWKTASIPQNAIPFTEQGHPYVLEFDEYTAGTLNPAGQPRHGWRGADHRHRQRGRTPRGRQPAPAPSISPPSTTPPATTRARSARPRGTPPTTATCRRA